MTQKSTGETVARMMQAIVLLKHGYRPLYQRCLSLVEASLRLDGEDNHAWAERLVRTNRFDPGSA